MELIFVIAVGVFVYLKFFKKKKASKNDEKSLMNWLVPQNIRSIRITAGSRFVQTAVLCWSENGVSKTYAADDIREFSTNFTPVSYAGGTGLAGTVQQLAQNARSKAETGLFIMAKDVDHPKWHIKIYSEQELARWMEILRQELSD
jgi:hypothetical protein